MKKELTAIWKQLKINKAIPLVLALLFTLAVSPASAQEKMTFKVADSLTYQLYQTGNWDALVRMGKEAISQGFDYYYLRIRLGIAYFSLTQYRLAAVHFEKALEFNSNDKISLQYLQQCYDWGGLETESSALYKRFPVLEEELNKPGLISDFSVFGGFALSGSSTQLENTDIDGEANIYGEINSNGNLQYGHAGLTLSPVQHFRLYLGYTSLQIEKHQRIVMEGADSLNKWYHLNQNQIHANLPVRIAKDWQFAPSVTILNFKDKPVAVAYDTTNYEYVIRHIDTSITNYIISLKLLKTMPFVDLGAIAGISNLDNDNQWQGTAVFNLYPFANLDLYNYSRISALMESEELRWHFRQTLGGKIFSRLWLQGSYQWGDLKNAHDENGLLVFNTSSDIASRLSATAFILITEKLTLQLEYTFTEQQDRYIGFTDYNAFITQHINYNNHNFMGGLKWKL